MILERIFGIALFINSGHIVSTNLKLQILVMRIMKIFLSGKNKSITKHSDRHSGLEDIKKRNHLIIRKRRHFINKKIICS
tara:strand:+ start:87 stop:326 length:240 start_codon:yes stop_codon:yes gene_type:complete